MKKQQEQSQKTPASTDKRRQSLVAFLGAIKFRQPREIAGSVERYFARPRPQARQRTALAEESYWVRSAN